MGDPLPAAIGLQENIEPRSWLTPQTFTLNCLFHACQVSHDNGRTGLGYFEVTQGIFTKVDSLDKRYLLITVVCAVLMR